MITESTQFAIDLNPDSRKFRYTGFVARGRVGYVIPDNYSHQPDMYVRMFLFAKNKFPTLKFEECELHSIHESICYNRQPLLMFRIPDEEPEFTESVGSDGDEFDNGNWIKTDTFDHRF